MLMMLWSKCAWKTKPTFYQDRGRGWWIGDIHSKFDTKVKAFSKRTRNLCWEGRDWRRLTSRWKSRRIVSHLIILQTTYVVGRRASKSTWTRKQYFIATPVQYIRPGFRDRETTPAIHAFAWIRVEISISKPMYSVERLRCYLADPVFSWSSVVESLRAWLV